MDLNASPLPEEDEQPLEEQVVEDIIEGGRIESSVETFRREREERRRRLKRENQDEGQKHSFHQTKNDFATQNRNSSSYRKVKQLPQGWLDCPPAGQCIGFIIPSKVPLDETYNESVLPGKRYSSKQVIHNQRRAGRDLGLVIDLTNTSRYYSPSEWIKQGIKHVKIPCKGRDAVPDNESVNIFVYEVMQFLSRQKHSKKYVLVHCTHGHNRTGFMIIHFLMRTQLSHVADALHMFSQARPPGIYKQDYIEALYTFYHENPENLVCPSTPEWKRSSDLDLNGEAVQDDDDDTETAGHLHGRGNAQFPGSHPVSLNRDNLQLLRQRYYYATWKADGTRYMMLISMHGCYLIDRNFCFRRVQMRFPLKNTTTSEGFHNLTLIDGEMIIDTIPGVGLKRRYLAYDLVAHLFLFLFSWCRVNSHSVVKLPFSERWKLLEEEIVRPRNLEKKQFECDGRFNPLYRYDMEPFGVRRKDFWLLSTVTKLVREFIPRLSHAADGLIFQGWDDPYVPRTHEGLLKWKYPEMNSVDFLFEVGSDNRELLFLYERGRKKLMDGARVLLSDEEDPSSLSGKIIECSWNKEDGCWVCMRCRVDKSTPNDINTYRKVMRSITDNITEEVLLNEIGEIIGLPMYGDRIAKAQQQQQHQRRR